LFAGLVLNKPSNYNAVKPKTRGNHMQKNKLLIISVLAAFLVCSALSTASAQDEIPPVNPSVDPEAEQKAIETQVIDDGNQSGPTFDPDAPVGSDGDPILYATGSSNSSDINANDDTEPYVEEDARTLTANDANNQNKNLAFAVVGAVLAIAVGGAIGVVYFRKSKAQTSA